LISKLATDKQKRELFARLSEHLKTLADHVAATIEPQGGGSRHLRLLSRTDVSRGLMQRLPQIHDRNVGLGRGAAANENRA
jgi:hypothetical protein